MTTRTVRTREERRDSVRRKLLQATEQLIAGGESYSSVSVERLASEAGVSRATFYIYFDSKAGLLQQGFVEAVDELRAAAAEWLALDASCTQQEMEQAILALLRAYRANASLLRASADEATQESALREQVAAVVRTGGDGLAAMIERGQADGWIDAALLAAETAAWAVWLLERGLTHLIATASDREIKRRAATLADMAWHTLRA